MISILSFLNSLIVPESSWFISHIHLFKSPWKVFLKGGEEPWMVVGQTLSLYQIQNSHIFFFSPQCLKLQIGVKRVFFPLRKAFSAILFFF